MKSNVFPFILIIPSSVDGASRNPFTLLRALELQAVQESLVRMCFLCAHAHALSHQLRN